MTSLLHGVRWSGVAQAARLIGQVVSVLALTRLLHPADYGVIAMASVFTVLATMLRDVGTTASIVQRAVLTEAMLCSVLWLNVALGVALGGTVFVLAPLIGDLCRERELGGVLRVAAVVFVGSGAIAVQQAILERQGEFRRLAIVEIVSQVLGLALALVAAMVGGGPYALMVPSIVATIVGYGLMRRLTGWAPTVRPRLGELRALLSFSGGLAGFNAINYVARNADSFIIGRWLGAVALGQYAIAYKLMLFPVQNLGWVVSRVLMPRLSRLADGSTMSEVRSTYFRAVNGVSTVAFPAVGLLWVLREEFVTRLLGSRWVEVPELLFWLAPTGAIQCVLSPTGALFTALGRTSTLFRLGVINTALCVSAFIVGAQSGIEYVAGLYAVANAVSFLVIGDATCRALGATRREFCGSVAGPVSCTAVLVGVAWIAKWMLAGFGLSVDFRFAVAAMTGAAAYTVCLRFFAPSSWDAVVRLIGLRR